MSRTLKNNKGYTLIELLIVLAIIAIVAAWIFGAVTLCRGNFWFSTNSVLRELKVEHPQVTEVLKTERNVFDKSVITVKENGLNHNYCLDTDILWNYKFSECPK